MKSTRHREVKSDHTAGHYSERKEKMYIYGAHKTDSSAYVLRSEDKRHCLGNQQGESDLACSSRRITEYKLAGWRLDRHRLPTQVDSRLRTLTL